MKIDKLYTLSQLIDNITASSESDFCSWVVGYNEFLKQPLKKEMFVNELTHPDQLFESGDAKEEALIIWKEAEKKVIFNCRLKDIGLGSIDIKVASVRIGYINDNVFISNYKNLSDLAERTNGQLKLQNIEL